MGCHYFKHIPCFRRIMGTDQRSVTLKSPFWTDFRVTLATLFLKRHGYRKGVCCICPNVLSYFMKKLYVFLFCRETALDLKQIWIFLVQLVQIAVLFQAFNWFSMLCLVLMAPSLKLTWSQESIYIYIFPCCTGINTLIERFLMVVAFQSKHSDYKTFWCWGVFIYLF